MNPMVVMSAVFAVASGAPTLQYAGVGVAPVGVGAVAAPLGVGAIGYGAVAAPVHIPAGPAVVPGPIVKEAIAGPDTFTRAQAPATQTKQVHYGQTTYVAGYDSTILKPAIPRLAIKVPTVLRQNVQVNPAIVDTKVEVHTVNEPNPVDTPYNVPYDVPVPVEQVVKVPYNVPVDRPYPVDVPVPVQGEPIINVRQQTVHRNFHTQSASVAAPAIQTVGYANAGYNGYAGAPALAHY